MVKKKKAGRPKGVKNGEGKVAAAVRKQVTAEMNKKNNKSNPMPRAGKYTWDRNVPTKYHPRYADLLVDHMKSGFSFASFAAVARVHVTTLFEWLKAHEAFKTAKSIGNSESLLFYERMGILGVSGDMKGFSTQGWIFIMKYRFGAREEPDAGSNNEIVLKFDCTRAPTVRTKNQHHRTE